MRIYMSLYSSFTHTYGTAQAAELQHHYFSPVFRLGVKQCLTVMGQAWFVCLLYAIATMFQLYHGGDIMYEMRRRKPESTLLQTQRIFSIAHYIGNV